MAKVNVINRYGYVVKVIDRKIRLDNNVRKVKYKNQLFEVYTDYEDGTGRFIEGDFIGVIFC